MITEFTVVAFDTTPRGHSLYRAFAEIYEGQFSLCPLRTTAATVPHFIHADIPILQTKCDPTSYHFPSNDDEDSSTSGTLTFRGSIVTDSADDNEHHQNQNETNPSVDKYDFFQFSFSEHKLAGATLAVIFAPQSIAARWAQSRTDVHVVPGSHSHRIWMERLGCLKEFVREQQQRLSAEQARQVGAQDLDRHIRRNAATATIKLNNLFPIVISDNVRRLSEFLQINSSSPQKNLAEVLNRLQFEVTIPLLLNNNKEIIGCAGGGKAFVGDIVVGLVEPAASSPSPSFVLRTTKPNPSSVNRYDIISCEFLKGAISIAPIGVRDSGTHCNSKPVDPTEGVPTIFGQPLNWMATDSGLVGIEQQLQRHHNDDEDEEENTNHKQISEKAMPFTCFGRVLNPSPSSSAASLNLRDLAVKPRSVIARTPIIAVTGTSAECGKTTLTCKLIKHLSAPSQRGLRVGAMKLTGTGGTEDSQNHREAGAVFTADQVDCGFGSTYQVPGEDFRRGIAAAFLAAEDAGVDVIVCELGGDVIFANNPELFKLDCFAQNLVGMLMIANDALSAYGGARWLSERFPLLAPKARIVNSPFRNFEGAKKRFAFLGLANPFDINDIDGMAKMFADGIIPNRKK